MTGTTDPNSATPGSYKRPEQSTVDQVVARIGDLQHRRLFYSRLENPEWVTALDEAGAFSEVPPMEVDEAGFLKVRPWPEGDYLVRMASRAPGDVAKILARHTETANPYLQRMILEAAVAMPATDSRELLSGVEGYLNSSAHVLIDAHDLVALTAKLENGGLHREALRLAQAVYRPRKLDGSDAVGGMPTRSSVGSPIDSYWYAETLPLLLRALAPQGNKILTTLRIWLEQYQILAGHYKVASDYDSSYIWRPSIEPHEQNQGSNDMGDALVEGILEFARDMLTTKAAEGLDEVLGILDRSEQPQICRIALSLLTEAVQNNLEDAAHRPLNRLLDVRLLDISYRHEYSVLARATLPRLDVQDAERWSVLIENGPYLDEAERATRADRFREAGEDPEAAAFRYKELWQLGITSAVGADALPGRARTLLTSLTERYGEYENAGFPSFISSSFGFPASPIPVEELRQLAADDLIRLLVETEPAEDDWNDPAEGLLRAVRSAIRERAEEFSSRAGELDNLRNRHLVLMVSAFEEAARSAEPLDWTSLLPVLLSHVAAEENPETERIRRYAAQLMEHGLSSKGSNIPLNLLAAALDLLEVLVRDPEPTVEYEERYGGDNMDPLTLSLNSTRPIALRAVALGARRAAEEVRKGQADLEPLIARALAILHDHFAYIRDPSLAVAAVFGESLASLAWTDKAWVDRELTKATELLGAGSEPYAYWDVVISTALAVYSPSPLLLDVIRNMAAQMIDRSGLGQRITAGWRTGRRSLELLGDHLLSLRIRGAVSLDDFLLNKFFTEAPIADRSSALGHLGWLLMRADTVEDEVLERAKEVWDWRRDAARNAQTVDELSGFHWWVRSGKFEPHWWLPRLSEAARSADFDSHGLISDQLRSAAPLAPREVLQILSGMLSSNTDPMRRHSLIEVAPSVLGSALDSEDPDLIEQAQHLLDDLGRQGYLDLREQVQRERRRDDAT